MSRLSLVGLALLLPFSSLQAQDKPLSGDKQKAFAADAMKKAGRQGRPGRRDRRTWSSPRPCRKRRRRLSPTGLDKVYVPAAKALKFERPTRSPRRWSFTFADLDQLPAVPAVGPEGAAGRRRDRVFDVRRDDPFVAVSARRGDKNPNFECWRATRSAGPCWRRRAATPGCREWMKDGFARAVAWRVNPRSARADRSAVVRLAPRLRRGPRQTPVVDKAWTGTGEEKDLIAASLMDFLTFGPGAESSAASSAPDPDGRDRCADVRGRLTSADWMVEDLDRAWREWVAKGSPAAK